MSLHFDTALLRWRRGESPVADLHAALDWAERMIAAIDEWHPEEHTITGYGLVWNIVRYASFLLDRPIAIPADRQALVRHHQSEHADVALDYHLLDAIEDRRWREGLDAPFARLAAKERQMLAVDTFRTYFALLDAAGDDARIEPLVRAAEVNYAKRARDAFYSGGPTYMGGGPDNPYVVDFALAAILKKIGWTGETIHRWRW